MKSDWNATYVASLTRHIESFEDHVGVAEDVRVAMTRCDGCLDECYLASLAAHAGNPAKGEQKVSTERRNPMID